MHGWPEPPVDKGRSTRHQTFVTESYRCTMLQLLRTGNDNPDFLALVQLLDRELAVRDGGDHAFFARFNKVDGIPHCMVAYLGEKPVCIGALKQFDEHTLEVKRMYTAKEVRGRGYAARLLQALEEWAASLGYTRLVLETGLKQPEALRLYRRCGYQIIPNYGQYAGVEGSVCFEKWLPG